MRSRLVGWRVVKVRSVGNSAFPTESRPDNPGRATPAQTRARVWLVNREPARQRAVDCHRAGVGRGVGCAGSLALTRRCRAPVKNSAQLGHICATTRGRIPQEMQGHTQAAEKPGAELREARKWRSRNLTAAGQRGLAGWRSGATSKCRAGF